MQRETFRLSTQPPTDPNFVAKMHDAVGLHVIPPDRAGVLRIDEKSRIRTRDHM